MKTKVKRALAALLILAAWMLLLATCSGGSAGGDTATISISVGNAASKATIGVEELKHVLTFSGPTGVQSRTINGSGTVKVTVFPGFWRIDVEGYYGDVLYSIGDASVEVKAGQNASVPIEMTVVWAGPGSPGGGKGGGAIPLYNVSVLMINDNGAGDSVTVTPTTSRAGANVTLNYVLDNTDPYNEIAFSGVSTGIAIVDSAGSSTRSYTVDPADADLSKNITINAKFLHTPLTTDQIDFTNTSGVIHVTYGAGTFSNPVDPASYSGYGAITYSSSIATVATVNSSGLVTILSAGSTVIIAAKAQSGIWAPSFESYTLIVDPKTVTITGLGASNKQYDNSTAATITGIAGATINDLVGSDNVYIDTNPSNTYATFDSVNVGANKTVTITVGLGGTEAANYTVSSWTTTAEITKATGSAVETPNQSISSSQTPNKVTVDAVNLLTSTGQLINYNISTISGITNPTDSNLMVTWQTSNALTVSAAGTYYVYAYAIADTNYNAGAISESAGIVVRSVAFDVNGGSATNPATQFVVNGSTASNPGSVAGTKSFNSYGQGLWSGDLSSINDSGSCTFNGWTGINSAITNNTTIYASWSDPTNYASGQSGLALIAAALDYVDVHSGPYTMFINSGTYSVPGSFLSINNSSANLIMRGTSGATVTIQLSSAGTLFTVNGGSLTIGSSIALQGVTNNGGKRIIQINTGGTVNLQAGGTIRGNEGAPAPLGDGGGVYVSGGTLNMSGGSITENKSIDMHGGGVRVNSGTFTMSGGEILNNEAVTAGTATCGGGVWVQSGTFTMTGGSIHDNHADGDTYGGVMVDPGGTFNINNDSYVYNNYSLNTPYNVGGLGTINNMSTPSLTSW